MTSTGNQTRVARMVAQWFTHYATAASFYSQHGLYSLYFSKIFHKYFFLQTFFNFVIKWCLCLIVRLSLITKLFDRLFYLYWLD